MNEKIDILIVEPGKAPRPAQVEYKDAVFAEILGGRYELHVFIRQRVVLVSRINGHALGLPPNRKNPFMDGYLSGTFLLCGFHGGCASLSPTQQQELQTRLARPEEYMQVGADTVCFTPNELLLATYTTTYGTPSPPARAWC